MKHHRFLAALMLVFPFVPTQAQEEEEIDSAALMNAMMQLFGGEEVTIKPTYTFQHQVTYKSEDHKWDGEVKKEEFDMHFSNGSSEIAMGMDMEEKEVKGRLLMVFDLSTMGMANFITTDTMKACMRMRIPGKGDDDGEKQGPT